MQAEVSSTSTSIRLQELELAKKAVEHEAQILREQVQQITMRMEASENQHQSAKLVMEQMLSCKKQLLEGKSCKIAEQEKTNAALQQQLQNFTIQLQDTQQLVEEALSVGPAAEEEGAARRCNAGVMAWGFGVSTAPGGTPAHTH